MREETTKLIEKAVAILKESGAREVYLFGSAASGEMREESDLDFAVSGLPPERFFKTIGHMDETIRCPFDVIDLDEVNPFVQYLKSEGKLKRVG